MLSHLRWIALWVYLSHSSRHVYQLRRSIMVTLASSSVVHDWLSEAHFAGDFGIQVAPQQQQKQAFPRHITLHYIKVIYSGHKYRTAKPLYTVYKTVTTGNEKEMTWKSGKFRVVSREQRAYELMQRRAADLHTRLSATGNAR